MMLAKEYFYHPEYYWDYVLDPFKTHPEVFMTLFRDFYEDEPKKAHLIPNGQFERYLDFSMGGKCLYYVMTSEVIRFWEDWGFEWYMNC